MFGSRITPCAFREMDHNASKHKDLIRNFHNPGQCMGKAQLYSIIQTREFRESAWSKLHLPLTTPSEGAFEMLEVHRWTTIPLICFRLISRPPFYQSRSNPIVLEYGMWDRSRVQSILCSILRQKTLFALRCSWISIRELRGIHNLMGC